MREDMFRLLVLRGKSGWRLKRKRRPKNEREAEAMPKREGMKKSVCHRRFFDEYLAPLRRFILKNDGRPWDSVYSEIRRNLRVSRAVHLHILEHLEHLVECDPVLEGGVYCTRRYGGLTPMTRSRMQVAYVDVQGILRAAPAERRRRHPRPPAHHA